MLNLITNINACRISMGTSLTGKRLDFSWADIASLPVICFLLIMADKALPISYGKISGAITFVSDVSWMIYSFSGSLSATAKNMFVSEIIFILTIVQLPVLFTRDHLIAT